MLPATGSVSLYTFRLLDVVWDCRLFRCQNNEVYSSSSAFRNFPTFLQSNFAWSWSFVKLRLSSNFLSNSLRCCRPSLGILINISAIFPESKQSKSSETLPFAGNLYFKLPTSWSIAMLDLWTLARNLSFSFLVGCLALPLIRFSLKAISASMSRFHFSSSLFENSAILVDASKS